MVSEVLKQGWCWLIVAGLLAGCAGLAPTPTATPLPTVPAFDWPVSTPAEQGLDPERLEQMFSVIEEEELEIRSVLIIRNDRIVTEEYFYPYQPATTHPVYSVTKSVISALVGIALEQGLIGSLDDPVLSYFPDRTPANSDPRKEKITLKHLLTMSSGLEWTDEQDTMRLARSDDWVQYVLDKPLAAGPGTVFNYNSGHTHLLSAIIQQQSGMSTRAFAQRHLFNPLGISGVHWETDPQGIPNGGWGLWLTARQMATFGSLYLHGGSWQGEQLIPADWVQASVARKMRVTDPLEPWELYLGYCWWIHPFGAYAAHGRGGQFIYVVPELEMVVVFISDLPGQEMVRPEMLIRNYVIPAARSDDKQ